MYYYYYLHQKYKDEKSYEKNKRLKFETNCFLNYIYNLFS